MGRSPSQVPLGPGAVSGQDSSLTRRLARRKGYGNLISRLVLQVGHVTASVPGWSLRPGPGLSPAESEARRQMVTVTVTLESTPGPAMISAEARFDDVVGLVLHRQAALAQPGRCNDAAMPTASSVIRVGPAAYRDPGRSAPVAGREEEKVLFKFSGLA